VTLVIRNVGQLVRVSDRGERAKRGTALRQLAVIENGALAIRHGTIAWVGRDVELPREFADDLTAERLDAGGRVVTPGLVDSHTHLIFAGSREREFEQRIEGQTYQEIAAAGGGIVATVEAVRRATHADLVALARPRLDRFLHFGVTTVEAKSGYGLSLADELKALEAIAELDAAGPVELVPTFLGAHAVPPEFRSNRSGYLRLLHDEILPAVARAKLAAFCDVFCETGVFDLAESESLLRRGVELGLKPKLHADELTPLGGAELAARLGAVSADHLLCITDAGIDALARSDTVATLLPGTAFFLGMDAAPARSLIASGAVIALASDCNPGTCPTENLPLIGTMACCTLKMTPAECLAALTLNAAAALGRADRIGSLEPGKQADLVVWDVTDFRQLFYHFGVSHAWRVVKRGRVVFPARPGPAR
jgi:imidazolonepropionase